METVYFNKLISGKIYPLIQTDPIEAKMQYEEYLEEYPKDYYVFLNYVQVLNILGQPTKAKEVLDEVINKSCFDNQFLYTNERIKKFHKMASMRKLEILANEEKYDS